MRSTTLLDSVHRTRATIAPHAALLAAALALGLAGSAAAAERVAWTNIGASGPAERFAGGVQAVTESGGWPAWAAAIGPGLEAAGYNQLWIAFPGGLWPAEYPDRFYPNGKTVSNHPDQWQIAARRLPWLADTEGFAAAIAALRERGVGATVYLGNPGYLAEPNPGFLQWAITSGISGVAFELGTQGNDDEVHRLYQTLIDRYGLRVWAEGALWGDAVYPRGLGFMMSLRLLEALRRSPRPGRLLPPPGSLVLCEQEDADQVAELGYRPLVRWRPRARSAR